MTVAVFYCRYGIDKDVVESFYKQSLFLVTFFITVMNLYVTENIYS